MVQKPLNVAGLVLVAILILASGSGPARAQQPLGMAFTYQGRLAEGGTPITDICNMSFKLYDQAGTGSPPSGGTLLGTASVTGVQVTDGYFTTVLDFGEGAFDGSARWLEVTVNCGAGLATLSPRQALTPTPYALYAPVAGNTPWTGLTGMPAGFADGTDADSLGGLSCTEGQVAKWNGAAWACAAEEGTIYTASTGLELLDTAFRIASSYRLPQGCVDGQIPAWIGTAWACAPDLNTADHGALAGLSDDDHAQYFHLGQNELVTGIPSFNGGTTGDSPPLRVDSSNLVTSLNTDLLDGQHASSFQVRVSGGCAANNSIRVIEVDGSVACEPDDNTTYSAGTGLDLLASQFSLQPGYRLPQACASGEVARWNGAAWACADVASSIWSLTGNTGTVAGTDFLGTTDNQPLEFKVNNARALRLEPNATSPNLVGGHASNFATAGVAGATIGGGGSGGTANRTTDNYGTIGGGAANQAGDAAGTLTDAAYATVAGGAGNAAEGQYGSVGGGAGNMATGAYATIPGGQAAEARLYGQMAYASGSFSDAGDAQASLYVLYRTTSNASQTELLLGGPSGNQRLIVDDGRTIAFDILVVARTLAGQSAAYHAVGAVENMGGTTSLVGTPTVTTLGEDVTAWTVAVQADDTNDALAIKVTGSSGTQVRWVATVRTSEVYWLLP